MRRGESRGAEGDLLTSGPPPPPFLHQAWKPEVQVQGGGGYGL